MPRGIFNWNFRDAVDFLEQHFFYLSHSVGSHHYYVGLVDGQERLVDVSRHDGKTYHPLTLQCIIHKSGIPKKVWRSWGEAGNKRERKKNQYQGAQVRVRTEITEEQKQV
jgi:predicted RNA binding protein YcfA (HicA-like mRNA interferase family)